MVHGSTGQRAEESSARGLGLRSPLLLISPCAPLRNRLRPPVRLQRVERDEAYKCIRDVRA